MPEPNLTELSIDELDQLSGELKQQQFAIREQRRTILRERTRKIFIKRIRDELTSSPTVRAAAASGLMTIPDDLTTDQAGEILAMVRQTKRPGDVRVEPAAGELSTQPSSPEVEGGDA